MSYETAQSPIGKSPARRLGVGKEGALYNPNYVDPSRLSMDEGVAGVATNYGLPQPMSSMAAQEIQKNYGYADKRDSLGPRSRSGLSKAGM